MMARKAVIRVKRAPKTPRKTKGENYLVNVKYLGTEPDFKGKVPNAELCRAFNWYNVMSEESDVREYFSDFYKLMKDEATLKKLKRVPYMRLPLTSAWIFRLHMRGAEIDVDMVKRAHERVKACFEHAEAEKKEEIEVKVEKPSIQDRIKDRVSDIIGSVEEMLDKGEAIEMYEWLQKNQIPAAHAKKIAEYYLPVRDEVAEAIEGSDPDLKEGYRRYTKSELNKLLTKYSELVDDAQRYSDNVKKARAPRKKKAPSTEKLLKYFKYQLESNEHKLKSIVPTTIIGAQELWTFNTKYNVLTVFRARGPAGLTINRTSIDGYDDTSSVSKRIGRKTEHYLKQVLTGGKIVLRRLMDDINSDPAKFADRINENTVLIRVT